MTDGITIAHFPLRRLDRIIVQLEELYRWEAGVRKRSFEPFGHALHDWFAQRYPDPVGMYIKSGQYFLGGASVMDEVMEFLKKDKENYRLLSDELFPDAHYRFETASVLHIYDLVSKPKEVHFS